MKCNRADIHFSCNDADRYSEKECKYTAKFDEKEIDGCRIGSLFIEIPRCETWDVTGIKSGNSVIVNLTVDELPERITCMYLFSEWWTRPFFTDSFTKVPEKTQVMYCKFEKHFSCILPLVGNVFKTTACASDNSEELRLTLDAGISGLRQLEEEIYIIADGETLKEAVEKAFKVLCKRFNLKPKAGRKLPEMFKYLGWCSWDAFYKDIDEEKIRAKAEELADKKIPVRWMLFDDGWMGNENDMLEGMLPDKEKFPRGFSNLISEIKENSMASWFGVWHAFGGYWAGIDPSSDLAKNEADHLYMTRNGRLIPSPETGAGFYSDWYKLLRAEQIDFVKVDGQSAIPIYFNEDMSIAEAARGMSAELEKGSEIMNKNVINCMGMAMENIVSRPETAISRNSDDFMPRKENGFAEHLLQNAYNAIYHDEIYYCDWDMFWTMHPDAKKHSLLRAISGGPVYFSDRIGETDPEIVGRMCFSDGKLLMMDRSACVSEDNAFSDPYSECGIKVQNVGTLCDGRKAGVVTAFNLTGKEQHVRISVADVPELDRCGAYYLYDYFNKKAEYLGAGDSKEVILKADEYAYFILMPCTDKSDVLCLGLAEKYLGFLTVNEISSDNNEVDIFVPEQGNITFIASKAPLYVKVNGVDHTEKLVAVNDNVYELKEEPSKAEMRIEFIK